MIPALTNHLWQSTLFAGAAALLAAALRRNRAQVRYWLWFSASLKFFIPLSRLMGLGSHLQWAPAAKKIATPAVSFTMVQITQPFPESVPLAPSAGGTDWKPTALLLLWVCGFGWIALIRFRGWLRIRAAVRASVPIEIPAPIEIRSSPGLLEPGVVGCVRPILLLPAGIAERLTPPQLEAVLAHELCHVRRRDNLLASLHMLVEATFWFHPLVWWIGARLVEERERACDEAVLSQGGEPRVYAEGILNVCKLYVESPLTCVSGVSGSDIKKRIEAIMTNRIVLRLNLGKKLLLAAAGILAATGPLMVGLMKAQSEAPLAFEVASVRQDKKYSFARKPWSPVVQGISGNRFAEELVSLTDLMMDAYSVKRYQIAGLPSWGDSGRDVYDIDAKVEGDRTLTQDQVRGMLRTLLADRFQLKLHHETRDLPVYALVAGKNGSKLTPAQEPCALGPGFKIRADGGRGGTADGTGGGPAGLRAPKGLSSWMQMPEMLGMFADRPIIDKTGLEAPFYCRSDGTDSVMDLILPLAAAAGPGRGAAPEVRNTIPDADPDAPSIFDLVDDKWGLKLEKQKAPIDVLVIDRVERPSEN